MTFGCLLVIVICLFVGDVVFVVDDNNVDDVDFDNDDFDNGSSDGC